MVHLAAVSVDAERVEPVAAGGLSVCWVCYIVMLHLVIFGAADLARGAVGLLHRIVPVVAYVPPLQTGRVDKVLAGAPVVPEFAARLYLKNGRYSRCFILSVAGFATYYLYSYIISCSVKIVNCITKLYLFGIALLPLSFRFFIFF